MFKKVERIVPVIMISAALLSGCNQTQNPSSGTSVSSGPPPQTMPAAPPPPQQQQPQQLTLYMVPTNPNSFSMESIQASKKKLEQAPNDLPSLISLADANFMIQRFETSQGYYERALKIDPKNINARLSLSNCYLFMQKPEEAIKELDQLLSVQKDYPEALFNKGLILLQSKGDTVGAKQTWTRLMTSHPEHQLAQQVRDQLARI